MTTTTNSTGIHDSRTCRASVEHVLITRQTCGCYRNEEQGGSCNVCDGGLAICSICGKAEVELDLPCNPHRCAFCARANEIEAMKAEIKAAACHSYSPRPDTAHGYCKDCGFHLSVHKQSTALLRELRPDDWERIDQLAADFSESRPKNVPESESSAAMRTLAEIREEWYKLALRYRVDTEVAVTVNRLLHEANKSGMADAPLVSDELCEGLDRIEEAIDKHTRTFTP